MMHAVEKLSFPFLGYPAKKPNQTEELEYIKAVLNNKSLREKRFDVSCFLYTQKSLLK
jgi:hypothetical protein